MGDEARGPREVSETEMREALEHVSRVLKREYGFEPVTASRTNGAGPKEWRDPVNIDDRLERMRYQGAGEVGINETMKSVVPAMLGKAYHPDEVFDRCLTRIEEEFTRAGATWDAKEERTMMAGRILCAYKLFLKDNDYGSGVIPTWLPGEFHAQWVGAVVAGGRPAFTRNRYNFHLRENLPPQEHKSDAQGDAGPQLPRVGAARPIHRRAYGVADKRSLA
jgi:hypothetical protein